MLKQKHFFNGAIHFLIGEDENGFDGKTVINVNRIIDGPYEDGTFVDIIHIVDNNYETVRVGSVIMPETMTANIDKLIESFSVFFDDFQDYYNMSVFKDLIRTMVIDEKWCSENSFIFRLFRDIIDSDKFENEEEFIKIRYYAPRYDDDGDHIYNASYEYHLYKDDLKYISHSEGDLESEEIDEDSFYDDDDIEDEDEIVEEVVVEEEEKTEEHHHHCEYSQIFSRRFFNEKNIDFSLFPFGYDKRGNEMYVELYASLPQDQDQALQMVKNTVANIELRFKPVATEWNTNPKLQELYEEIKKYNLEVVEGDKSWFHDKGNTLVNSKELRELMKEVLDIIGLEQDPDTDYWKLRKEN